LGFVIEEEFVDQLRND